MKSIEHKISHLYQSTNSNCSQTALSILLSYLKISISPEEIMRDVPVGNNEKGEPWGTINQQLATWCIKQGLVVEMHTADFEIIDLSWANLSKDELLLSLKAVLESRNIPGLGKVHSRLYVQSYIDFLEAGGKLHIHPYMTTKLINNLLVKGPLHIVINHNVFFNSGRYKFDGLRRLKLDDKDGKTGNHSVVIYGLDQAGNYLIADPWEKPGFHVVEPEKLLCSMTASQIECDNLFFQVSIKKD